jgi:minor tail protein
VADKKITFGFFAKDNGVERTLDKIGNATADAAEETSKLAKGQLEVREAALNAKRADDQLATARQKLSKVTQLAAASDQDKRKASLQVEAAEIKHEKALRGVADAADKARKSVDEAGNAAHDAGEKAKGGSKGFLSFSKDLGGGLRGGLKTGLAALPMMALAGGLLVGAALVKGIKQTLDFQDATAKLKVQMGLTEAQSAAIGKSAGHLYVQAYGESMGQVRDAIKSVVQNGAVLNGTMSKDLEDVSGKVLNLANTFDQDLGGVTRAVGQMLRTGMAKDGAQALDILTKGFQNGADKADDLLDTFNEYPTQFRKLGLSGTQAMGLISQGLKAGARDSDLAADALKEFSIRAVDGSKTTSDGFKSLGLNADTMAHKIAAGGKSAAGGLDTVMDRLRAIKDPVERSRIAVELFGTQAEDLGDALFAMDPSTAVAALGKVGGAADQMGKDLTTPQARLTGLKRTLEMKVQGWLLQAFDWFNAHRLDIADGLLNVADSAITLIRPLAGIASIGLRVGAALMYVAGAAAFSKGNFKQGKELFDFAGKLNDAAGKASKLGDELAQKASPQVARLRAEVAAMRSKQITLAAIDNASKAAQRIRAELAKTPSNKNITIQVTSAGTVQRVQREINSITGKVVAIQVGSVRTGVRGFASGTDSAPPGWAWTGEEGPELVRMRGGEQVLDAKASKALSSFAGGLPGYAAGTASMYQWGQISSGRWDQLMAQGWKGRAGDGMEAIYAPAARRTTPRIGGDMLQPIVLQLDNRIVWQGLVKLRQGVGPLGLD